MNGIQKVVGPIPIVSTKLSLDAIRVPVSFFIELSGSRFNQSKWTNFVGRVPPQKPPLHRGGFSLHIGSPNKGELPTKIG